MSRLYLILIIYGLLMMICRACDDPGKITFLPPFATTSKLRVRMDESIVITCCHPDGARYLNWHDTENRIIPVGTNEGVIVLKDEQNRLILSMTNFSKSHFGEYSCQNPVKRLSRLIYITRRDESLAPQIVNKEVMLPNNKPIRLNCPVTSQQGIQGWSFSRGGKNDVARVGNYMNYELASDKSFLILKSPQGNPVMETVKMVWCYFQEVTASGDLKNGIYKISWILYEPLNVRITMENKGPIIAGKDLTMICHFRSDSYTFVQFPKYHKPNFVIDSTNNQNGMTVLTIKRIAKNDDGAYECLVSKIFPEYGGQPVTETASIDIKVVEAPKIMRSDGLTRVKSGDSASLSCKIDGIQLDIAQFEHFRRSDKRWIMIEKSKRYIIKLTNYTDFSMLNLTIKGAMWDDRGDYRCSARNPAGLDSHIRQLKVEKTPELYSPKKELLLAMKSITVDCIVSAYPSYNAQNVVKLVNLNQSAFIKIEQQNREYDDIDGLTVTYKVSNEGQASEGETYILECSYENKQDGETMKFPIVLEVPSKPKIPQVSVVCAGPSGVVLKYQISPSNKKSEIIVKSHLYYAPASEFDKVDKSYSTIVNKSPSENEYVLTNLIPQTDYTLKWESYNEYGMASDFLMLQTRTLALRPPKTPKDILFDPVDNEIKVVVMLDDTCPYAGVDSEIASIYVRVNGVQNDVPYNWVWVERNFTKGSDNTLTFFMKLDKPKQDYEVDVAIQSLQGTSGFAKKSYQAQKVLVGHLFSCYPRCSSHKNSSFFSFVQTVFVAFIFVLLR